MKLKIRLNIFYINLFLNFIFEIKKFIFKNQSNLIKSETFQSSKLPSGKYLLIIKGILFSINSFSAIEIGSISSEITKKNLYQFKS